MGLCEAAAYNKLQGKSLWDRMIEMYEEYGYYREGAVSVTMKGADGAQKIAAILDNLRKNPISEIGGFKVLEARDYKLHTVKNLVTGEEGVTDLPESNVLYYVLENDQWCCVRPSGTEPKIKFYYGIKGSSMEEADKLFDEVGAAIKKLA